VGYSEMVSEDENTSGRADRQKPRTEIHFWPWMLAITSLAALLLFSSLGARAVWGPEGRWAEIAREMRLTGNYFWPTINGQVYYDKPLLSYWLVVGTGLITGGINETAARLPSAAAGLLGIVLLIFLARRLYDVRTAILAGFILTTSYSYVFFSRLASADMETVTGVLATLALFVRNKKGESKWWVITLWLIMSITSLTKGLIGFALPLLVMGIYSILAEGWPKLFEGISQGPLGTRLRWLAGRYDWLLSWKTILAAALAGGIYYLPFAVSATRMHSDIGIYMVFRENLVRFFHAFDHEGPVYLYAYAIFWLAAPWSLFLPAALVQAHSNPRKRDDRFTLIYFWVTFIFFTLSGSRRYYYLLPILPAAAMLFARLFAAKREELNRRARMLMNLGYILLGALVVAFGALVWLPSSIRPGLSVWLSVLPGRMSLAVFWAFMLATLVFALPDLRPRRILLSVSAFAYLGFLFLFVFLLPRGERYRGEKGFAEAVRRELKGDMSRLVFYKIRGPGLLFYLSAKEPIPEYNEAADMARLAGNQLPCLVILAASDLAAFPFPGSIVLRSQEYHLEDSDHPKDKFILLRLTPEARLDGSSRVESPGSLPNHSAGF